MKVDRSSNSIIAVLQDVASSELVLEAFKEARRKGVDSSENVPVDEASTWRCGHGSLVNPSVISVDHEHKVTIGNFSNSGVGGSFVPGERLEEPGDHTLLVRRKVVPFGVSIVDGPEDTNSGCDEATLGTVIGEVDGVHLKIVILSVNCVLG
jgi:hypothetical protein